MKKYFLSLILSFIFVGTLSAGTTYYISKTGSDSGTVGPFATMTYALSVAQGGDTIIINSGIYNQDDIGRFWNFQGSASSKINVRGEADDHFSVTLEGFYVIKGDGADIRHIKFASAGINPGATVGIISIGANYITVADCFITGRDNDYGSTVNPFDGIKIIGKTYNDSSVRPRDITISNCLIKNCPEDAIDNTGAKDVKYLDNIITRCGLIQIKGGVENLNIERNKIYKTSIGGIFAGGMDTVGTYTGNAEMPLITPVSDRFGGKNINIFNNVMFDVKNEFVKIGWNGVQIINNTFDSHNVGKSAISLVNSSMKYYDDDALNSGLEYASGNDSGGDYVKIYHPAKNVSFQNNILYNHNVEISKHLVAMDSNFMNNFLGENNLYHSYNGTSAEFWIDGTSYWGVITFPYENSSSVTLENADPGFRDSDNNTYQLENTSGVATDGTATVNTLDYCGMPRYTSTPSVGAFGAKKEVMHLKFNDNSNDSSRFSNHGTTVQTPVYVEGVNGKAIELNGTDQYITISDADTLDITSQLTLSAWIKRDTNNGYDMIVGKSRAYIFAVDSSNKLYFNLYDGSAWRAAAYSNSVIQTGVWTHVAATYSKSDGEVKIYIDGQLDKTTTITSPFSIDVNNYTVEVGRTWSSWMFDGSIDDVKIFDITLNESQLNDIQIRESNVMWLKFGYATGNLRDSSGNINDGTLQGNATYGSGYYKQGLSLSGNSGDYAYVSDNQTLRVNAGVTLSAWIKMTTTNNYDMIVGKNQAYLLAVDNYDNLYFNIYNGSSWVGATYSSTKIQPDIWTHVAATYDKATGEIKIYIDGMLNNTKTITSSSISANTQRVEIGRVWGGWEFGGSIDDVMIHNRALNGLEICRIMLDQ
ncbi:MAG: LamG domain-containing protein [Victivallaceae bacterium]|nr:LamG domain-containing protein [Victivallaceae bacterium]